MDFTEALPLLRDGKRVTRRLWLELDGRIGSWLELADGPPFARPVLLVWREDPQGFMPWAGAQNDVLQDDWELA
jgi:hypothetical protein